jgi:hypothetical protein
VWILPGLAVLAHNAARARGLRRWAGWAGPGRSDPGGVRLLARLLGRHPVLIPAGLIWYAPASYSRSATTRVR